MASEGRRDVVSMDQIEQFKENIQPVRGGRSATSLARTMNSSSTVLLELEQMKQKFEQQIENDEKEEIADPLATWFKYVSWAQVKFFSISPFSSSVPPTPPYFFYSSPKEKLPQKQFFLQNHFGKMHQKVWKGRALSRKQSDAPVVDYDGRYID